MAGLRRVADGALTVGAVLGAITLVLAAMGALVGVRPLVFRSGSMAPAIDTGALALSRSVPAAELRVGDVVSVPTASGSRVAHRVVRTERSGDGARLTLRGDANGSADQGEYAVDSAYRVFWHVPWLGYAVGAVLSPAGLFALGLAAMALLVIATRRRGRPGPPSSGSGGARRAPPAHRARRAGATAVATMAVVAGPGMVGPASAAPWTDSVTVAGTTLTATTVPAPATFTCSPAIASTTFSWSAVAGASDYTFHYGSAGSLTKVVAGTSTSVAGLISGGTAWVVANRNFGSVTWSSVPSQSRTYTNLLLVLGSCS